MVVERLFDTVLQQRLIQALSDTVGDGRVVSLVHRFLRAGAIAGGENSHAKKHPTTFGMVATDPREKQLENDSAMTGITDDATQCCSFNRPQSRMETAAQCLRRAMP